LTVDEPIDKFAASKYAAFNVPFQVIKLSVLGLLVILL
jgi:hypothetical protein